MSAKDKPKNEAARQERQAAALRANLRRRKAQQRAREDAGPPKEKSREET